MHKPPLTPTSFHLRRRDMRVPTSLLCYFFRGPTRLASLYDLLSRRRPISTKDMLHLL